MMTIDDYPEYLALGYLLNQNMLKYDDVVTSFGSMAEAMILSATGFFLGPFVYFSHEKAWEYLAVDSAAKTAPTREIALLPAPSQVIRPSY